MPRTRAARAKAASARGARDLLIMLLTVPWCLLGPANIFKIAVVNRGSPVAKYIVVPPAEECQANCNIARMWGCLFWGVQAVVAASIVAGAIDDRAAAAAKLYVGVALIVAYFNDVVRVPVLVAGSVELVVAGLLLSRSIARRAKAD
mmetsp:Transcript_9090/g.28414  ORF Transcript_9090/g.28414 Transcript_9090/m.28414 type:complete len:147 (-) Transcript_9090:64-504(-)